MVNSWAGSDLSINESVLSRAQETHLAYRDSSNAMCKPDDQGRAGNQWCLSRRKRLFDLAISVPVLLLASPVMAVVACVIKLSSPGPVLFRQERVGLNQQSFRIFKFRTMMTQPARQVDGCAASTGPGVTRRGDPRLTPVGGLLRQLKLDELPQLLNVIQGEMSLVGPRPKLASHQRGTLPCRPGITGAATLVFAEEEALLEGIAPDQVEDYTVNVFNTIKHRLDLAYVQEANLGTDLKILLRTAFRDAAKSNAVLAQSLRGESFSGVPAAWSVPSL